MAFHRRNTWPIAVAATAALLAAVVAYSLMRLGDGPEAGLGAAATGAKAQGDATGPSAAVSGGPPTVNLSDSQLGSVKVEPAGEREFPIEKESVGSIDFNQEMTVQVFTPYQGRIVGLFAKVGDDVRKGQTLFTIDSPDLLQAEATLIAAAGVLEFTTRNLARLRELDKTRAVSQKDMEQAASDQQTAEGALRAARDSVRLFGKTDAEIDRIIAERKADSILVVPSPIAGRVTARNAAPGLFGQAASPPAPYLVADISTMCMLAHVPENASPAFRVGQEVKVKVSAFPERTFEVRISTIGSMVDPMTRRVLIRSEVQNPRDELRSGKVATFGIRTGPPVRS